MHILILAGFIGVIAFAASRTPGVQQPLKPHGLTKQQIQDLARVKAFMDVVRGGLTVAKADVVKFRNLALKVYSPELAALTLLLMQLKSSGMGTIQVVK